MLLYILSDVILRTTGLYIISIFKDEIKAELKNFLQVTLC